VGFIKILALVSTSEVGQKIQKINFYSLIWSRENKIAKCTKNGVSLAQPSRSTKIMSSPGWEPLV
jgi:hypothetical protein